MLLTVRRLFSQPQLKLRLLTKDAALPAGALDATVEWVHSSDLADPTPFLSPGQVLLTTGTQFDRDGPGDDLYLDYVARLQRRGIAALGFGTEVVRDGTPDALVAACLSQGLPLVEVPYLTPFIAVARAAAEMVAEERYARHTWALSAQRAISLAALRPDGLSATLSELSRQLDHWVALFDVGGNVDHVFPRDAFAGEVLSGSSFATVQSEARRLLARGQRASATIVVGGETLTLQTLGRRDQLRGVLALGGAAELDQASHDVVTSVIALAGLALEQNHALAGARGHLRSGLLHVLLGGNRELAESISHEMWGPLPVEPVLCAVTSVAGPRHDAMTEFLEVRVEEQQGTVFFAVQDDTVVLVLHPSARAVLDDFCRTFGLHAGLSDPTDYSDLARALAQAGQAHERSYEGEPSVVEFDTISRQGVLAFLARTDAREVGRATLAPVLGHDAAHGTELLRTVQVWLEHNGAFDAAARVLGVHRHTVRSRIELAETLLGRDLGAFHARADVWAALLATAPA
ncbi:PucR family transcriptional regulator [Glaciibacter psychrotolerans]|uniref:Purine catabolism regulator n=1 Tax=Glaciibacter psychrotolerans TaxID=670054 RepID=A0A7Z0ED38_9MICO|nr:PucR family transcriptional regulator [Leifsonia psychrotolerans]NYJ19231.1 purine catabolism regulator [Leifsonia psychrotolerans]